jgi:hypothetical protein
LIGFYILTVSRRRKKADEVKMESLEGEGLAE